MDPASHDLYMFLEKLQEQQKEVVNLIKERQRIIAERDGTPLPAGPVFVPGGTTVPASIKAQSPATVKEQSPASAKTWAASPAGANPLHSLPFQFRRSFLAAHSNIPPPPLPSAVLHPLYAMHWPAVLSRHPIMPSLLQESRSDKIDRLPILHLCCKHCGHKQIKLMCVSVSETCTHCSAQRGHPRSALPAGCPVSS